MTIQAPFARARRSRPCSSFAPPQPPRPYDIPASVEAVAKAQITAGALEAPIRFLASDALEGRGPATRGDSLARLYLASQLQQLGYLPGGDNGGWEQGFDIVGVTAQLPAVWSFNGKGGPST